MKIWPIHLGELLPVDGNARLFRYGIPADMLAAQGHDVTRWDPTFSHGVGKQRVERDTVVELAANHRIRLLYSPGYRRHVGRSRVRFHKRIARSYARSVQNVAPPDIILTGMPPPEMCARSVERGRRRGIPVVIDVRDLWPDISWMCCRRRRGPETGGFFEEPLRSRRFLRAISAGAWPPPAETEVQETAYSTLGIAATPSRRARGHP